MSSKITGTGAVLPYMTHLMNDAREALTSKDREIEHLRNLLRRSEMIMEELRLALEDSIQEIEKLRAALRTCIARAGAPDPVEACRLVIMTAEEALQQK